MSQHDQFTLGLFDTTGLAGIEFGAGSVTPPVFHDDDEDDAPEAAATQAAGQDHRLTGARALASGWRERARANIRAIQLSKAIEAAGRPATAEEQDLLAAYVGFGASDLAQNCFKRPGETDYRPGWAEIGEALDAVTTPEEHAALARATQYAHYTPEGVVRWIWTLLARLGFAGGRVLEPGLGSGLFLSLMPGAVAARAQVTGVEYDPVTARIARLLFPRATVLEGDFTKLPDPGRFDLAIGNPPFSDRVIRTGIAYQGDGLRLHDWFIARSVSLLRPGGLAVFVTSTGTMDKEDDTARRTIAGLADLVAAVRLPEGTFRATAGTDVAVDVLVFQRRDDAAQPDATALGDWLAVTNVAVEGVVAGEDAPEETVRINAYFAARPWAVLGRHAIASGPFGPGYACLPRPGFDLEAELHGQLQHLPVIGPLPAPRSEAEAAAIETAARVRVGTAADGAQAKEGSYLIGALGGIEQVVNGRPLPVAVKEGNAKTGIPAKHARLIRLMIPVRDALREVLRAQVEGADCKPAQARLRTAYSGFVRRNGPINATLVTATTDPATGEERLAHRMPNIEPFRDDPDCWLVASIEHYDLETNIGRMGPVFDQVVLSPPSPPVIRSATDALAVCLSSRGRVDMDVLCELLDQDEARVVEALGDTVFQVPGTVRWETADEYLSGTVRSKLAEARAVAATDPRCERHVRALEAVQPRDLAPSDITARLGAPWIPTEIVERFVREVLRGDATIRHSVEVAFWAVEAAGFANSAEGTSTWGTARRHAGLLLSDALNNSTPQIWDTVSNGSGGTTQELNVEATEACKEKLAAIRETFAEWVWTCPDRAAALCRIYNDGYNNLVARHFDGAHLELPGASSVITMRPHQKRVVWRVIADGDTYIAHAVGAGKTYSLAAAVMEQRRLGLITTAMLVVPGHCLAQASREFLQLYPLARILVADEENFASDKRHRFMARATTDTWDAIIITHSAFKLIPVPASFERRMIEDELDVYERVLGNVDASDHLTRKRVERLKEGLADKLEALSRRRDDMVTLEELGVDQILFDEAQEARKLSFATNQINLKGVQPEGSQRAWDLYVKRWFLDAKRPGRALVLASGTPVTNTMGELYTAKRFLSPGLLRERGVHEFDAWCSTFCETRTELELQPSGLYKPVTRLSTFVNVAEMTAMFRRKADVVTKADLRQYVKLPRVKGGRRQLITAAATAGFKAYQARLAERIAVIESRKGRPRKGDDILLSVITDGRHAAIDLRLVIDNHPDEPENKLNLMIRNAFAIWQETAARTYLSPSGEPYPIPGAAQMIFSDLGTIAVEATRGFSAYRWIKRELVRLGVPACEIAFMQDYKKSAVKQRLFNDVNAGRVRLLIGSTGTMGTGTNAQTRLIALHHQDVPWLPSDIEQREGRIERQGNQNEEIGLYAYATLGSTDATMWQNNERKARFIEAALKGDPTLRRLDEDEGSAASQFAMAKAIASGDDRLMRRAGLESEIARLTRQRAAHFDDQVAVRWEVANMQGSIARCERLIPSVKRDLARRRPTRGDLFAMTVGERSYADRRAAGNALLLALREAELTACPGTVAVGTIGGFSVNATVRRDWRRNGWQVELTIERDDQESIIEHDRETPALGIVAKLEHKLAGFEEEITCYENELARARARLDGYLPRLGEPFAYQEMLNAKLAELRELEADLAATKSEKPALEASGSAAKATGSIPADGSAAPPMTAMAA